MPNNRRIHEVCGRAWVSHRAVLAVDGCGGPYIRYHVCPDDFERAPRPGIPFPASGSFEPSEDDEEP